MKRFWIASVDALLLASTLFVLFVLFTGKYELEFAGFFFGGWSLAYSLIFVLVLVLFRMLLRKDPLQLAPGFLLFSLVLIVYLSNGRTIAHGDSLPARYLPLSILREGNFNLDEFPFLYKKEEPYFLVEVNGHHVSYYPVGAPLLALPFYMVSAVGGVDPQSPVITELEKISASCIVALSVFVLYRLLLMLTTRRFAILLALIYAFGTSSFSNSSQALWQHGPSQLALAAALYALFRGQEKPNWIWLSGFFLSFAIICRPTDILIALPIGIYVLIWHRREVVKFVLCGLPAALFQLLYNYFNFGDPLRLQVSNQPVWVTPFLEGLSGLLISPGRGLFVYSPIFLFSLVGVVLLMRRKTNPIFAFLGAGLVIVICLYSKWKIWWGGGSFGPRLLADTTPLLITFLFPLREVVTQKRMVKIFFILLAVISVATHSIGVYDHDILFWNAGVDVDHHPENLWDWNNNQLVIPIHQAISRASIALFGVPTSAGSNNLEATYSTDLEDPVEISPSRSFEFTVTTLNSGSAVWIAGRNEAGSVRLRCRWLRGKRVLRQTRVVRLLQDVTPGDQQDILVSLTSPREAGSYTLEIELFTDRGNFSDLGSAPLRRKVIVR